MGTKRKYTKGKLESAAKKSQCFSQMIYALGGKPSGNTYQLIKCYIKEYNIDISHFLGKKAGWIISGLSSKKRHFSEILQDKQKRRVKSYLLRRALKDSGELYVCKCCGLNPEWNGKKLTLHVDHINSNWSDCRKENLRFLCPNCHSQITVYNKLSKDINHCKDCNKEISSLSVRCRKCNSFIKYKTSKRKVIKRPALDILLEEVKNLGYKGTGRKYGVSDNAIRKWIRVEKENRIE